jgi:hypothetical protein
MDPVVDVTLRAALALLLLAAAAHKTRDLAQFRATLADYRLLPDAIVPAAVGLVVGVELAIAVALVAFPAPGLVAAAALLAVYAAAIAINLVRGRRHIDCGCAGPAARQAISGWLVARNVVLATLAIAGLAPVHARPLLWVDALTVAGTTAVLAAFYATLDRMLADAPALARVRGVA